MFKVTPQSILEQDTLRRIEALCTQEEPPGCEAACPLHLDVRAMNGHIASGEFKEAARLYTKAIPFAAIIAHTCSAPCQGVCKRGQVGGAIEIRKLEQALAEGYCKPAKPPMLLPKKTEKIAVIGGGLRGMTAGLELCKKGYKVTIFDKQERLGGKLWDNPALPQQVLQGEIDALAKFPIELRLGENMGVDDLDGVQAIMDEGGYQAAYVACRSELVYHGQSLITGLPNVLAGSREGRMGEGASSIYDAYDGKSAATTLDRILQKVSVEAGRVREGSVETKLFTNIEGVEPVPPVQAESYTDQQATEEAGRCLHCECLECVKKCGFMQHYNSYPRKLAREVYNNLSIAMGIHHANAMINSCALCGQCGSICPNGLDMAEIYTAARNRMVSAGKMPPSAHEFAMLDMQYSLSDSFYLAKHQPGCEGSAYAFFPGCQLAASEPGLTRTVYEDLSARLSGGVGLMLGCCGVMAKWAGDDASYTQAQEQLCQSWQQLGCPTIIAGCPTCMNTLREMGMQAISIFETLTKEGTPQPPEGREEATPNYEADSSRPNHPKGARTKHPKGAKPEYYQHHACGARHDEGLKQDVARLAAGIGVELVQQDKTDESPCCGYGGLAPFAHADVAKDITDVALGQMPELPTVTYCVNCRDRYLHSGADSYHLLELLYPAAELRRQWPTWSERQQNRADLKRGLLQELWREQLPEEDALKLIMDKPLAEKLEADKILDNDIRAAIEQAEAQDCKLRQPDTGRFITSYRPGNVTFWVEYEPEGDGWRVHNAYCHRVAAVVTSSITNARED